MDNKATIGKQGEDKAVEYLKQKGYEIMELNYRYKRSEIDIIAQKENLLIFVEVKTKSYNTFGNPEDAVDQKKSDKIMEGADYYIEANDWHNNIRFDIIAIHKQGNTFDIVHFEDAFY